MRVEHGAAVVCALLAQANWKKRDGTAWHPSDFMEHITEAERDGPPISMEEAMRQWQ